MKPYIPAIDSVWDTDDGYVIVVAVRDDWAWVKPCTVNGYVRSKKPAIQTNLGWFREWFAVGTRFLNQAV